MKPVIGISMGDPSGIGPEVIVKTLTEIASRDSFIPLVIGDSSVLEETIDRLQLDIRITSFHKLEDLRYEKGKIHIYDFARIDRKNFEFGIVHEGCGDFSFRVVVEAVELAKQNRIDALVTAPICKESWHLANHHFDGHTGLLADLTKSRDYRMMFSSEKLKTILVTTHLSLRDACDRITTERVYDTIRLGFEHMRALGNKNPRIAVCGLNPHAGENKIFGTEDFEIIKPAVAEARSKGITAEGPTSADTTFLKASNGLFDLVVAQYHDQGLIPIKLISFDTGVNVTVGLPIIRTSVDHGTAFDIAGQGIADHRNMICAIDYALKMVANK